MTLPEYSESPYGVSIKSNTAAIEDRYTVGPTISTLVASVWIPSYVNDVPADIKKRGQFITEGTMTVEDFDSITVECGSLTTRIHRKFVFDETLTKLNEIKSAASSQVSYQDEINVPATLTVDATRSYAEWHQAASETRRFILRLNQVHCVLNYGSVGGIDDNPRLGQWARIWTHKPSRSGTVFVSGPTTKGRFENVKFVRNRAQQGSDVYASADIVQGSIHMINARINMTDGMQLTNEQEDVDAVIHRGFVSEMGNAFATCASTFDLCSTNHRCVERPTTELNDGVGKLFINVALNRPVKSSTLGKFQI